MSKPVIRKQVTMTDAPPRRSTIFSIHTDESGDGVKPEASLPDFSSSGVSYREYKIARTRLRKLLGITYRAQKVVKATNARRYHRLGLAGEKKEVITTATTFEPPALSPRTAVLNEMDKDRVEAATKEFFTEYFVWADKNYPTDDGEF